METRTALHLSNAIFAAASACLIDVPFAEHVHSNHITSGRFREFEGIFQRLPLKCGALTKPCGLQRCVTIVTSFVIYEVSNSIEGTPPRSTHRLHVMTWLEVNELLNAVSGPVHISSFELVLIRTLLVEQSSNKTVNCFFIELFRCQELRTLMEPIQEETGQAESFFRSLYDRIIEVMDVRHTEVTGTLSEGHGQSVLTDDTNRSKHDGQCLAPDMRVIHKNVSFHPVIAWESKAIIYRRQTPDLAAKIEGPGSLKCHGTGVREPLEELERIAVLDWFILRTTDSQCRHEL